MISNRQLFLNNVAQTSTAPLMLEIERAEGMYLYSQQGKRYLDLIAGISVSNLGHSHPAVVQAVQQQAAHYMHLMVYGEFVQSPQVLYAQKLTSYLPQQLSTVYFTNSGAEATEGAMKLAKRLTGRSQFISFKKGYHGSTQGALSILGDEYFKRNYRPLLPDTLQLHYGIKAELESISERTAAVFIEPIQAESGITIPSKEYMLALQKRCQQVGALLILDEAQTGLGRTGKLFAFEHFNIVPDILLLAKALGGGMPLGAFISSYKNMQVFTDNPVLGHITTFGGHPVCCAAGLAAFNVLTELPAALLNTVEEKGKLFEKLLVHPKIKAKSRIGLMMSLTFENYEQNKRIIDSCIARGVLTDWFLFAPDCMRIAPPFIITEKEIEWACTIILECID